MRDRKVTYNDKLGSSSRIEDEKDDEEYEKEARTIEEEKIKAETLQSTPAAEPDPMVDDAGTTEENGADTSSYTSALGGSNTEKDE